METIVSLCKRRGFIFQSSEIYGGLASTWDYGPLGVELKRNIKEAWWRRFVWERDDMVGLDAAILMHPEAWRASGHVAAFHDPLVECKECHMRWREDQLPASSGRKCPNCGGELGEARQFNLMLKTHLGPVEDTASVAYFRPETAQGIFVNFENVLTATRRKLPFGIAQIGKAFRNEITTGNFIFRTREFEMLEIEFFVRPGDDEQWHKRWLDDCRAWYTGLGVNPANLRLRQHEPDELAHYAKATYDIEYRFPWGWGEIQGIANRTDFDLKAHATASGKQLSYFDEETKQQVVPYVIEPSAGVDRAVLTFLLDAYHEEDAPTGEGKTEKRVVLRLHPDIAPVKVAVLPLSRKDNLVELARKVHRSIYASGLVNGLVQYDDAQSIGRRYRRQDEVGTPLCVTVDFDSLESDTLRDTVTVRERD
ncbi:MAG: glycine--tRNA ligase, partial [SAR202 cluster bacterium]|nr:glycine--tRNA ligase [SAR202 cluster bacterium]